MGPAHRDHAGTSSNKGHTALQACQIGCQSSGMHPTRSSCQQHMQWRPARDFYLSATHAVAFYSFTCRHNMQEVIAERERLAASDSASDQAAAAAPVLIVAREAHTITQLAHVRCPSTAATHWSSCRTSTLPHHAI